MGRGVYSPFLLFPAREDLAIKKTLKLSFYPNLAHPVKEGSFGLIGGCGRNH